ncbi:Microtubule-associated protein, microtubule dynamics during spindle orientation [Thelotrema lepadinum]|nr:Microtubule-associated protein, microtubule dynamics during spindle orientation [Thelotrema lepadinum]
MADQEEDFSSLPLQDRFTHKNWKVRKEGYEDAAKEFEKTPDESAPVFRPFLMDPGLWKGAAADSNVAAQQEGLAALCAFLKYGGKEHASKTRNSTVPPILEKGLPSTRPAAKQSALEALMLYVEIDKADPVVEEIIQVLSHKQPKVIAAALSATTQLFHAYGVKIIDPKPVLKAMPKVFGHADKNVRAEASNLVVELYRWLKDAIKSLFWNDLKPVQQQDLEKLFEPVRAEPPPKQERLLRSQQAAVAAPAVSGADEGAEDGGEEEAPEEEEIILAEPIDVYSKLPKDFHERLASSKWKDRKDALDDFYAVANTERIQEGPFDDVVSVLAKSMKDANVAVVTVAANCVEVLAKGLKKSFAKYRGRIMAPMLEKCKEKKQSVADALGAALDAVFMSTHLSDCLEEILEFLKHKNPQVKLETLRFLIRCLKTTREAPSTGETKAIADAATKLLTESTEVTRSGGAEILGTLMKIMGERAMNPYLDGLDDIRKTKIKEYFDTAEVKAKNKPKPAAPAKSAHAPAGQKRAPSKKAPAAAAKKPSAPSPAPVEELSAPPSAVKTLARPGLGSKLAGPSKSGLAPPGGGLKAPQKLARPGLSAAPSASPKRNISPQTYEDDPASQPPRQPRIGLGASRGLAGRTLSKPNPASSLSTETPSASAPSASSGLSAADRAELEDLRTESSRLKKLNEDLRSDKSRLETEINDLRTHEAELIEERTRNRLTIKAKETQLVRARSDAEVAEETVAKQTREMDRLKRELARTVRATSPPPPNTSTGGGGGEFSSRSSADGIYRDGPASAASANGSMPAPHHSVANLDRYESNRASREVGYQRARSYMSSPSEEKENGSLYEGAAGGMLGVKGGRGAGSPAKFAGREFDRESARSGSPGGTSVSRGGGGGEGGSLTTEPIENWRRAAEVTSALKAKIDLLKTRQGLQR